ncbi:hypothetical protein Rhe02_83790 [Rhizocola hellebori]|uniref:DUF2637 domain-containing protein n=1 Tax=Rhizocola hellebori TaxID=1392758 RepID=A0A8J3QIK9_9ACTN|nr:hypothetical protein Rhe02_83790 [Rhizocola hellebori]
MTVNNIPGAHTRPVRKPTAGQRFEDSVLVLILLAVGIAAGAGSFTHVHDWTMNNSPADKADWFGWANAVISELVPVASLLVIRRRKRAGQPIAYPAFLLVLALALSVTAQLAVAKPGFSGGLVAVVPALAFAALAKLILGKDPRPDTEPDPRPANLPAYVAPVTLMHPQNSVVSTPSIPIPRPIPDETAVLPNRVQDDQPITPAQSPTTITPVPAQVPVKVSTAAPLPAQLLDRARQAADDFMAEHGRTITLDELRTVLRVSNATTGDIMRALGLTEPPRVLANAHTAVSPLTGKPLL